MKKTFLLIAFPLLLLLTGGCKKEYLDTNSPVAITDEVAFKSYNSSLSILNGVLSRFYTYGWGQGLAGEGCMSFHAQLDFMGDDVINSKPAYYMYHYRWEGISDEKHPFVDAVWDFFYDKIKVLNNFISKVETIKESTPEQKKLLEGEARILRAYCYHQLVQLYGKRFVKGGANADLGVVLRDETSKLDPMPRSTVKECYDFIVKDIDKALELMKGQPIPEGYQANWVGLTTAHAIAARVYQTMGEWDKVVEHTKLSLDAAGAEGFHLVSNPQELLNGFNDASCPEWIWGYRVVPEQYKSYGSFFAAFSYSGQMKNDGIKIAVNRDIYDPMGPKDVRRNWWVCQDLGHTPPKGSEFYFDNAEETGTPIKFNSSKPGDKSAPGDEFVMRLPLVYYMRAEALARKGDEAGAKAVLEEVMKTRDPDYKADSFSGDALIGEILRNKRVELWFEGERFFDMKRLSVVPNRLNSKNAQIIKNKYPNSQFEKRNSGPNAVYIPRTAESPNWEFMIPLAELEGANGQVKQNPLHEQAN